MEQQEETEENQAEKDRLRAQLIRLRDAQPGPGHEPEAADQGGDKQGPDDRRSMNSAEAMALVDMTLSSITHVAGKGSLNLKQLNEFETATAKMLDLNIDLLQRENLTMSAIAKLKLLKRLQKELTAQEKAKLWNQFTAILSGDKRATKFQIRNLALQDEIGGKLYDIEKALDENRAKKRIEKEKRNLKMGLRRTKPKQLKVVDPDDPFKGTEELSYNSDESGFKSQASRSNFWDKIDPPNTDGRRAPMSHKDSKSSLDLTSQFSFAETIKTGFVSRQSKPMK